MLYKNFVDRFFQFVEIVCKISLVLQVIITAWVVFGRFVLDRTPSWGEELSLFFMVWFCLLSSSVAMRGDYHLKVAVLDMVFGPRVVKTCDIIGKIAVLVFSGYMLVEGIRFLEISSINRMTGINISLSWLFISVPVAAAAWIIALVDNFKRMFE